MGLKPKKTRSAQKKAMNKVALQPGRSLMDWIRLTSSGKDLTGVGGEFLDVTLDELKKHKKRDDAWLSLKGKVYNVTSYLEFHPGGIEELEKGIGKDATKLFMEVHSWVNFESMLRKCVVGRLTAFKLPPPLLPPPTKMDKEEKEEEEEEEEIVIQEISGKLSSEAITTKNNFLVSYDWFQSNETVVVVLYAKQNKMNEENVILDVIGYKELLLTIYLEDFVNYVHFDLENSITDVTEVKSIGNKKVEIKLHKCQFHKWVELGIPLWRNKTWSSLTDKDTRYRPCKLVTRRPVTKNTFLLTFEFVEGSRMKIPVAGHVSFKLNCCDVERSYTPIPKTLKEKEKNDGQHVHFMIKIYPDGVMTSQINKLNIGDLIELSDYLNMSVDVSSFSSFERVVMLAAGTGLTPMTSLLHHLLLGDVEMTANMKIRLLFFNKTEEDILWKEQLDDLASRYKRFEVIYVLSEPSSKWSGPTGRVNLHLLEELALKWKSQYFFICGPTSFNQSCFRFLQQTGRDGKQVHVFPNN